MEEKLPKRKGLRLKDYDYSNNDYVDVEIGQSLISTANSLNSQTIMVIICRSSKTASTSRFVGFPKLYKVLENNHCNDFFANFN